MASAKDRAKAAIANQDGPAAEAAMTEWLQEDPQAAQEALDQALAAGAMRSAAQSN